MGGFLENAYLERSRVDILGNGFGLGFGWGLDQVVILVEDPRLWGKFMQDQRRLDIRRRDRVQLLCVNERELKHGIGRKRGLRPE